MRTVILISLFIVASCSPIKVKTKNLNYNTGDVVCLKPNNVKVLIDSRGYYDDDPDYYGHYYLSNKQKKYISFNEYEIIN